MKTTGTFIYDDEKQKLMLLKEDGTPLLPLLLKLPATDGKIVHAVKLNEVGLWMNDHGVVEIVSTEPSLMSTLRFWAERAYRRVWQLLTD